MEEIVWVPSPGKDVLASPIKAQKSLYGYISPAWRGSRRMGTTCFKTEREAKSKAIEVRSYYLSYWLGKVSISQAQSKDKAE